MTDAHEKWTGRRPQGFVGVGFGLPPPPTSPIPAALANFFRLPFQPDHSADDLAKGANEVLSALPRGASKDERERVIDSINGMFARLDKWSKSSLDALREQARNEVVREMHGTADSILWIEPTTFDQSTYILDEKTGARLELLAKQLARRTAYVAHGIRAPTRLIFNGGPGTGKTMGAQWLAAHLGVPIGIVRADELNSHFIAMTSKNISAVVKEAEARGGILFLDEVDGLFMRRDGFGTGGTSEEFRRITTAFLQILNHQPREQIIICATNLLERLDPAMLRRFPTRVTFTPPDANARRKIAMMVLGKMDVNEDAMGQLVDRTDGGSGDHVTNVAHTAASYAIDDGDMVPIGVAHVRRALIDVPQPPPLDEHVTTIRG